MVYLLDARVLAYTRPFARVASDSARLKRSICTANRRLSDHRVPTATQSCSHQPSNNMINKACPSCGRVNWSSAPNCLSCSAPVDTNGADASRRNKHRHGQPRRSSYPRLPGPLVTCAVCGLIVFLTWWFVSVRSPVRNGVADAMDQTSAAASSAADSTTGSASDPTPATVAEPPTELGVDAPNLEYFASLLEDEITNQNGVWITKPGTSSTTDPFERWSKHQGEIRDRLGPYCAGEGRDLIECRSLRADIRADIDAREGERLRAMKMFCAPRVDGPIVLSESGRYNKLGSDIFYAGKVKADGFEGRLENGGCVFSKGVVPLTAKIYLKWSAVPGSEGWQASSQGEFSAVSLARDKEVKQAKKEEIEKARYERWQQQGSEEANRRMQQPPSGPFIER